METEKMEKPFRLDMVSVRLVKEAPLFSDHKLITPEDAVAAVGEMLCDMDREVMCVINLKTDGTPINCSIASIGALNYAIAEPKELFRSAILSNAAYMIMAHNHPSANLMPSKEDVRVTDRMAKLGALLGISLADHVIVGGDNSQYFSFREKGLIRNQALSFSADYKDLDFGQPVLAAEKGRAR